MEPNASVAGPRRRYGFPGFGSDDESEKVSPGRAVGQNRFVSLAMRSVINAQELEEE